MRKREGEKIHVKVLFCHTKTRQVNPFFANIFQRTLSVKYILFFLLFFFSEIFKSWPFNLISLSNKLTGPGRRLASLFSCDLNSPVWHFFLPG